MEGEQDGANGVGKEGKGEIEREEERRRRRRGGGKGGKRRNKRDEEKEGGCEGREKEKDKYLILFSFFPSSSVLAVFGYFDRYLYFKVYF